MPERPRILQMGPDPAIGGGMAAAMRGLLASPLIDRYELEVIPTYRDPKPLSRLTLYALALTRLTLWSLRGRGRIVHIHATVRGSAYRKAVCALLAKALRRRVVFHVHSGAGDIAAFRRALGGPGLALVRAAFSVSDEVLAVSAASAAALVEAYGLATVTVVPNAAPLVPLFARPPGTVGEGVHIVYLGGFANPVKGGEEMVEAVGLALACEPGLRVTLAGPGELPAAAAALLAERPAVAWAGWLGPEEKDELLRAAEVFVMPSLSEGLPMALLEAMAYGMAIAATAVGGIPEVVDDGREGLLVPAGRSAALADAICRLAAEPRLRAELAEGARQRVEQLDAIEVAGRLASLYESLA